MGVKHFIAAYAVCSKSFCTDEFKKFSLDICLDGIMNLYVMSFSQFRYMVKCAAEELHVVIVEWSGDVVELFYCIDI